MLITLECRDRKKKQDVMWIEQLAAKKDSLQIDRTIAVSAKAFTRNAMLKAKRYGIDLRVLSEVTPDDIKGWLSPATIKVEAHGFDIVGEPHIVVAIVPGEHPESMQFAGKKTGDVVLSRDGKTATHSVTDVLQGMVEAEKIFQRVPENTTQDFEVDKRFRGEWFALTNLGLRKVLQIKGRVRLTRTVHEAPRSKAVEYLDVGSDSAVPIRRSEYVVTLPAINRTIRASFQGKAGEPSMDGIVEVFPPDVTPI